jgi:hypothetical protein
MIAASYILALLRELWKMKEYNSRLGASGSPI